MHLNRLPMIRGEKKTEKPIKPRKPKNKKKQLEFLKNQPVRFGFGFISLKLKKSNQTQTGKKPSQTGKTEPNQFFF